jgi:peptide/nickel transport system ATP-binding protein/oligopeptide transport system ATP-binding protein
VTGAAGDPLVDVAGLRKEFVVNGGLVSRLLGTTRRLAAVRGVDFSIGAGETLALVGESGAGKSTVGSLVTRLLAPTAGTVRYRGRDVHDLSGDDLAEFRRSVQMVFQDPYSSLDPRWSIGRTMAEPLAIHTDLDKAARVARVEELLETVNLPPEFRTRYPHELSGGQLQRVSIATALTVDPEFVVLDEPVSALDVSVQARVLNLLMRLQRERDLSYLFVSHDLGVVKHIADRAAVLYLGEIVERGPTADLFADPAHPYTEGLLASIPQPDPTVSRRQDRLEGEIPSPLSPPSGCSFHPRCAYATDDCRRDAPAVEAVAGDRRVACHHWRDVVDGAPTGDGDAADAASDSDGRLDAEATD